MDTAAVRKVYRHYARFYDYLFGALLQPGRRAAVQAMGCRPGDRILEVGVGTGLSLPLYPANVRVTGIDLCPEMLARASARRRRLGHANVETLQVMDAEHMDFPDDVFDCVVAMYVASVVPDPARLLSEMKRVCQPGGNIFVLNHFHSSNVLLKRMEKLLAPISPKLGFRADYSLESFVLDAGMKIDEMRPVKPFGFWTLLQMDNDKCADGRRVAVRTAAGAAIEQSITMQRCNE